MCGERARCIQAMRNQTLFTNTLRLRMCLFRKLSVVRALFHFYARFYIFGYIVRLITTPAQQQRRNKEKKFVYFRPILDLVGNVVVVGVCVFFLLLL